MLQSNAAPVTTTKFQTKTFAVPAKHTLYVSDLVLQNPLGDSGILQVRAGSTVLFNFGLANFRSVDYHFVQALTFTKAHPLVLAVECKNTTKTNCTAGLSFSGVMHKS
jgi:hypothetical protein